MTILDSPSLRLTTAMTLEAWVNPSLVNRAWRDVLYKGNDNYYLMGTSSRSSAAPVAGGTFAEKWASSALVVNQWTHLAVTYDKAVLRLYVNGVQAGSRNANGNAMDRVTKSYGPGRERCVRSIATLALPDRQERSR